MFVNYHSFPSILLVYLFGACCTLKRTKYFGTQYASVPMCIYIYLLSGSWWHFPHENCHKMIANLPPPNFCRAPLSNTEELMEHQVRSHPPMVNEDVCTRWRPSFLAKLVYFTWGWLFAWSCMIVTLTRWVYKPEMLKLHHGNHS